MHGLKRYSLVGWQTHTVFRMSFLTLILAASSVFLHFILEYQTGLAEMFAPDGVSGSDIMENFRQ